MPKLGHFRKKKIYLPSYEDPKDKAWVEVALDYPLKWVNELNEAKDDVKKGWQFAARLIQSWNLTDEAGKVMPINTETVQELNSTDQNAILKVISDVSDVSKLTVKEKKS